ncbi:MAG TPA: serine/threonine-protein kinase [Planctomycetota bacterium]|nr:serine/threonine-protein kinase [Planctomycetota bacterium]
MRSLAGYQTEALRFERLLGCGGMGDVYIGLQRRLHRLVAIKVVAAHLASDARTRSRFEREAQVMSRLQHPNVVSCYDYGPIAGPEGDELFVLVLEYVDGDHLGTLTAQERPVREILEWTRQAALGLHAAHELGIIHRDVKPENILVASARPSLDPRSIIGSSGPTALLPGAPPPNPHGIAKIADFGLARADDVVSVTQTGAVVGTPAYMAPETCLRGEMTPRSDIYGLGCTLYHALTGEVPYAGRNAMAVIEQHVGASPPRLADRRPDLAELDPLLRRCLAKDPRERFTDAAALADELRLIASRLPAKATTRATTVLMPHPAAPRPHAAPAAVPPRRVPTAALIAALILVSAVGIGAAWRHRAPDPDLVRQRDELMERLQRVESELAQRQAQDAEPPVPTAGARLDERRPEGENPPLAAQPTP